jgi:hypothetical protein
LIILLRGKRVTFNMDQPVEVGAGLHASRREAGLHCQCLLNSEETRVLNHSHFIIVVNPRVVEPEPEPRQL